MIMRTFIFIQLNKRGEFFDKEVIRQIALTIAKLMLCQLIIRAIIKGILNWKINDKIKKIGKQKRNSFDEKEKEKEKEGK